MKKKLIFNLLLLLCINIQAQYINTTVYTPKGTAVQARILSGQDYTDAMKAAIKNQILNQYPMAEFLGDATYSYNCHSYAWYMSEGGLQIIWLNALDDTYSPNLMKYWTDGSYVQVCNEADAEKIHYYSGNHSAIRSTSVSGKYESKWGSNLRLRHDATYVPLEYDGNLRNYYVSTKISGNTGNFCSGTRTFSVKNITGASYLWTLSPNLSVVGSINSNQITVQKSTSTSGSAWAEVQISTPCSATPATSRINFYVNSPITTGSYNTGIGTQTITANTTGPNYVSPAPTIIYFTANNTEAVNNGSAYTIQKIFGSSTVNIAGKNANFSLGNYSANNPTIGTLTLLTTTNTNCGAVTQAFSFTSQGQCTNCGTSYRISPNPANDVIVIEEIEEHTGKTVKSGTMEAVKITDKSGNIVYLKSSIDPTLKHKLQISVNQLNTDAYTLSIFNGKEWKAQQIIISK